MDSDDGLKWFGEGFDGFPKKLPEDVVEYIIFIIDARLSDIQTRERLQAFQRALQDLKKKFLKEYIWQRDDIKLDLVREEDRWLLKGQTNYGDSVADEWLIVHLLRELSKEFKDAWIRVYDTDGEFLLIEAANALPKWLTPEVAEHRVWINTHRLLIVPLGKAEDPAPLKLQDALTILKDKPGRPQHYVKVEKEAFHRLNNYPSAISENQHHATLPLPRKVAHILHTAPSYISSAVEAFYLRDPISLRLLQPEKSKSALIFPPEDFVQVSVRFTKVLYAQLLGQHWNPPPQYESAIENLVRSGHAQEKSEVAIKLTAGMQMLASHTLFADKKAVREINLLLEDLDNGDDTLPTDTEISAWPKREDDESWLDIDFSEFEKELQGKGGEKGFGDKNAQGNLKKMVERFNTFLADDEAGHEGANADEKDPMDEDNDSDPGRGWDDPEDSDDDDDGDEEDKPSASTSKGKPATKSKTATLPKVPKVEDNDDDDGNTTTHSEDDADADAEYAEYEKYFEKYMTLPAHEKAMLTEDARELARAQDAEAEEDAEIERLTEAMEAELFGHGALNLNPAQSDKATSRTLTNDGRPDGDTKTKDKGKGKGKAKVSFSPPLETDDIEEIPRENATASEDSDPDDDEDDNILDEDYNLVQNMLAAFKGQAGAAGPAGNMLKAMGIQFPQDADDEIQGSGSGAGKSERKSDVGEGRASANPMRKQDWYMK